MDEQLDLSTINFEDLQEEYQKLRERYTQLIVINEQDTQRIHELRRNLDTATAAEIYLSQELEQLSSTQSSYDDGLLHKKQNEIEELKKRQNLLIAENEDLNQDMSDLRAENKKLNQKIKELTLAACPAEITYQIPKEHLDLKEKLEEENLELLAKLDETHESITKFTMSLAEKEKHIEILKDQVMCLEENLQSKRDEVEEKSQLLESAQEQIVEMNAKIAMLTSSPDNAERKGNSLFAEVDDQRQAMKQLLANQKKSYMHMKKVFNESQHEIRRLKRENFAMHNELQACSVIFCSADKTYKEKLNERILQLMKQNEDLEKKLMFTQQELISLANDKGVVWLDSMLLFCKQETDELKKQLHSIRIQKGIIEERLRNSQQDLAKWRFEALKTRCILIDREGLLADNNINFKTFTNKDVHLTDVEIENAKPQLGFINHSQSVDKSNKNLKSSKEATGQIEKSMPRIVVELEDSDVEVVEVVEACKLEDITTIEVKCSVENAQEQCQQPKEENTREEMFERFKDVQTQEETFQRPKEEHPNEEETFERPKEEETEEEPCRQTLEQLPAHTREEQSEQTIECKKEPDTLHTELSRALNCKANIKVEEQSSQIEVINSEESSLHLKDVKIKLEPNDNENKENISLAPPEIVALPNQCAKLSLKEPNRNTDPAEDIKPRPSILVTHKNVLDDESVAKNVRFAQTAEPSKSASDKPKYVCKATRNKSNVIVRRILVNSKVKTEPSTPPAPPL